MVPEKGKEKRYTLMVLNRRISGCGKIAFAEAVLLAEVPLEETAAFLEVQAEAAEAKETLGG